MTGKISQVKVTKVLHLYFSGMPQPKIAKKCNINQGTVSRCATKFEKRVATVGITAAAKEDWIMEEVSSLRSLSVELQKSKVTVEEAKSGLKILQLFNSMGVPPEEHKALVKAVLKLKDADFIKSAKNLVKLEEYTGKSYTEIVDEYEQLGSEITERQKVISALKEKQESQKKTLQELDLTREKKEAEIMEVEKKTKQKVAEMDAAIGEKMAEAELTLDRIAKLQPVVGILKELGLADDKFKTYLEERQTLEGYGINWPEFKILAEALTKTGEFNTKGLAGKLVEYGSLEQAVGAAEDNMASLQPQVVELEKAKEQLTEAVNKQDTKKVKLEVEVEHLEKLRNTLSGTIDVMQAQRSSLEKHLAGLEQDVAELESRNVALTQEVSLKEQKVAEMDKKLEATEALDKELKEKEEVVKELNTKVAAAGQKYHLFEAFLGLVGAKTGAELEEFLKSADALVNLVKTGKYDPNFLRNSIIGQLAGGELDLLTCQHCGAEFVMIKRGQPGILTGCVSVGVPERCPDCAGFQTISIKTHLAETLKKELETKKSIVVTKPGKNIQEKKG